MTRIHKMLLVTALTVVGVWGCAKPAQPAASADKLKQLEARVAKLETDLRTVTADRDATRATLAGSETRVAELQRQVREWSAKAGTAEKERDDLVAKLKAKTTERDLVQAQFDSFRKNIKELLGQVEGTAAAPAVGGPAPIVAGLKAPGL